ncbi:MAG: T9SS type A sorting domain-containing protein [Flavobacteriales bacterium]|jgi:hypothetical protein|nr:T9SS type A sorting domain-containing protein [Flavobacteriales bacterium]
MKLLSSIILIFIILFAVAQEELAPLRYNSALLEPLDEKTGAIHNDFIYAIDTIKLPLIDDFSKDKFKKYTADTADAHVSDTTWYRLNVGGVAEPMGTTYMTDTTFTYTYDTVPGSGFDSIILVSKTPFPSTFVDVYDIDNYEITIQNTEVWPAHNYYDSLWTGSAPDLILVEQAPDLFQDSSTVYFVAPLPEDSFDIWIDSYVYRNNTYPINPLSIGVATFDGLNANGYPYDWSSPSAEGIADYLTSKPIQLGTKVGGGNYTDADSIYLSFAFQTTGLGEAPEEEDSLVLEFWSPVFASWTSVWVSPGVPQDDFEVVMIPITESFYLQNGFQFRFKNYGTLTGSLDHWHIDYVILDDFRTIDDNKMNDWAFQYPAPSLLKNYTSMPWYHYETDPYGLLKTSVEVETFNSLNQAKIIQPSGMDLLYESTLVDNVPYVNTAGNVGAFSNFDMSYDLPSTFYFDTILAHADTSLIFNVQYTLSTNTTPERLTDNDTIVTDQIFHDYYAYDDGSAEAAFGLVTNGAELAYKFTLPNGIQDTLKSIDMHFVSSVNDVSNSLFFLQIWDDNNGQPGELIYTTDDENLPVTFRPHYNWGNNSFYEYILPEGVVVSGTYYIGWKQSSSDRLNIGFDKNIDNSAKIFYNLGTNWSNTSFSGSLMMRPVFKTSYDSFLSMNEKVEASNVRVYPNPSSSHVTFEIDKEINGSIELYDMYGRVVYNAQFIGASQQIQVNTLAEGNYIGVLKDEQGVVLTKKKLLILR